jgi:hypothetical protein
MKKYKSLLCKIFFVFFGIISFSINALPKIHVEHKTNGQGVPSVKVTNKTALTLACYVAIDGYKKRFILQPFNSSKRFSASSNLYDHTNFSTW